MTAAGTTLQRGTCPICGRDVALKASGAVRGHRPPTYLQDPDRRWAMCHGAGQQPTAAGS